MSFNSRFTYKRLKNEGVLEEEPPQLLELVRTVNRRKSWSRYIKRGSSRRRLKIRIPGLKRFLRKKVKLFSAVRGSYQKVVQRFLEGRSHMGDLFAGNYLFMVSPTTFKSHEKAYLNNLQGLTAKYSLSKIA
ncbi:hypothetical protein ACHQM5_010967 [Ranunculus cassubicifolius]